MAFNFPHAGLVINPAGEGTVDTPMGHPINATAFGRMAVSNVALGTMDYPLITLAGLGYALSRRNPNIAGELDALHYGVEGLDLPAIFGSITTAANAGFVVTTPAGNPLEVGFEIIREAMDWAQSNIGVLRHLTAADFYVLPAIVGGGNPPRLRVSYSLLVESSTGLMRAAVEVVCLGGFVHTAASRNAASRYAQFYDTVIDELANPPIANQADAFSRVFTHSGLPPQLAVYPVALGERYSHTLLRFHYVGGTHAQRRAAFILYSPLLLPKVPVLQRFLTPPCGVAQRRFGTTWRLCREPIRRAKETSWTWQPPLSTRGTLRCNRRRTAQYQSRSQHFRATCMWSASWTRAVCRTCHKRSFGAW